MNFSRGVSVIEVVVVIAIVGLLLGVATAPFGKFRQRQALENTTNAIVGILNEARARTLAGTNGTNYSVRFETNQSILFSGSAYTAGAVTNEIYTYEEPVTMSAIALTAGASTITFDRLKGTTSQTGTITLSNTNNETQVITIGATGTVIRN